jgi:uncharacterized protein with FMN-binding domain
MKRNKALTVLMIIVAVIVVLVIAGKALGATAAAATASYPEIRASTKAYAIPVLADGAYKGSAFLFPVSVKVSVHVGDGAIRSIDLVKHFNGQGKPAEAIVADVVAKQSLGVDVISGATHSSLTILKAIQDALSKGSKR